MLIIYASQNTNTVDPCLSGYNGTRPWPDNYSEIAGYVNYHANRIYNAAVFYLVMLSNVSANNHISGSSGFGWSKSGMFKC